MSPNDQLSIRHEALNLLQVISLQAEMLKDGAIDEDGHGKALDTILEASEKCSKILRQSKST